MLAACTPETSTTVATQAAERQLQDFLSATYGATASLVASWASHDDHERLLQRQVCANQAVDVRGQAHRLLAVCATVNDAGHAESGLIDFFVLRHEAQGWQVAASQRDGAFGSFGRPGDVSTLRLGHDFYGFRVDQSWVGQGYLIGTQSIVVPRGERLAVAAAVRSSLDNEGAIDCDDEPRCEARKLDLRFDLRVDQAAPEAKVYPLLVREHGRDCGRTLERSYRLDFDPATGQYAVPEALQREDCQSDDDARPTPVIGSPQH